VRFQLRMRAAVRDPSLLPNVQIRLKRSVLHLAPMSVMAHLWAQEGGNGHSEWGAPQDIPGAHGGELLDLFGVREKRLCHVPNVR
jgi:hypothetical protein